MGGPLIEEVSQVIAHVVELGELEVDKEYILVLLHKNVPEVYIIMAEHSFSVSQ